MQHSQLIALTQCLQKNEWKALHDFAASPIHNSRADVQDLLRYIEHYLPKVKSTHLEKEKAWSKIFPKKKYDDAAMRYLMFLAQQTIEQFLSFSAWQKNELTNQIKYLSNLRKRNASDKLLDAEFKKTTQLFEKQTLKNHDFYFNTYEFQVERHEYNITQKREAIDGFQSFSDALNIYFMAQKLRQGCAVLSQSALNNSDIRVDFLKEVLTFVEQKNAMPEVPLVALFYHIYHALLDSEDSVHFGKFKELLFSMSEQFTQSELRELYLYAINCCIRRLNADKKEYVSEAFDIYRKGLETKALLEGNILSRYTYNNIVKIGVRLKEFDWTENFIIAYKPFLEEKFRENIANHVAATFYFTKKDYSKAMQFLQQSEFDDVLHNIDARRMLACIYYDLKEYITLDAHLEAFKNFLYRHKQIGYHRENCLNFIRFIRRFLILEKGNKPELEALETEIIQTSQVVEKVWLLEKIKEF